MTRATILLSFVVALAGCRSPRVGFIEPTKERIVWPAPPERPRLSFLGTIESDFASRSNNRSIVGLVLWGPEPRPRLVTPHAIAVHDEGGRIAIADPSAGCVHLLSLETGRYTHIASDGDLSVRLETPIGVAWSNDTLCIADAGLHAVILLEPNGRHRTIGADDLERPAGIAVDPETRQIYVSDAAAHEILILSFDGRVLRRIGTHGSAGDGLNFPSQLARSRDGTLFVADTLNFRIQRFSPSRTALGPFGKKGDAGGDFALPKGVALDSRGNLWVVDAQFENVQAFDPEGRLLLAVGREGHDPGEFWLPAGAAIDRRDRLWIADTYNRRIQVFQILP